MNIVKQNRKWISWIVVFTFMFLIQASSAPARSESSIGSDSAMAKEKDADGSGSVEKAAKPPAKVKKKSILPWILIGVGVVAAGAAVYFLVLNKKYTLKVDLGEGVSGTPASGSQKFKKGTTVNYSYTISGGYKDLVVTLDGAAVAASGSLKMDSDHTLAASSTKVASIAVNSTPTGALIYDNGASTGKQTNTVLNYAAAGSHNILLRLCGYQDYEQTVQAQMGQQQTVNATLKEGIRDEFGTGIASCWKLLNPGQWKVEGGLLKGTTAAPGAFDCALYNVPFTKTSYTVTVKMNAISGSIGIYNTALCILLSEGTDFASLKGYIFACYPSGLFQVLRMDSFSAATSSGPVITLKSGWAPAASGIGGWNTLKVVRSGDTYAFSINDVLYYTIADSVYKPGYTSMLYGSITSMEAHIDFIIQEMGAAARQQQRPAMEPGAAPCLPPGRILGEK